MTKVAVFLLNDTYIESAEAFIATLGTDYEVEWSEHTLTVWYN